MVGCTLNGRLGNARAFLPKPCQGVTGGEGAVIVVEATLADKILAQRLLTALVVEFRGRIDERLRVANDIVTTVGCGGEGAAQAPLRNPCVA